MRCAFGCGKLWFSAGPSLKRGGGHSISFFRLPWKHKSSRFQQDELTGIKIVIEKVAFMLLTGQCKWFVKERWEMVLVREASDNAWGASYIFGITLWMLPWNLVATQSWSVLPLLPVHLEHHFLTPFFMFRCFALSATVWELYLDGERSMPFATQTSHARKRSEFDWIAALAAMVKAAFINAECCITHCGPCSS